MVKDITESCCFTGHRHLKMSDMQIMQKVNGLIRKAIKQGITHFISGGAIGFDIICAEQVLHLKSVGFDITLEIAVPCENQTKNWPQTWLIRYEQILKSADKVNLCSKEYHKEAMMLRNKYMVSNSCLVISYFLGEPSGTKNTLDYAREKGKEIWNIA